MVNTRTDADLSAAVQNALQTLLPQIHAEIREEFHTSSGPSNSGGNPPPVTIHTWLECFNKQKPRSFEKATAPVDAENWISHMEKIFDVIGCENAFKTRLATNTETSTEFIQHFLRLAGFLGAAAGTEEDQTKNFEWGLRRNSSNGHDQRNRGQQSNRPANSGYNGLLYEEGRYNYGIRAEEIHEEFRTSSGPSNSGGNPPPVTIHTWLERFNKQKPRSFEKATAPVKAENWISHMEKIFDVMGCEDAFKTILAAYKFEGNSLAWWKAYKQSKSGDERLKREYHSIRQTNTETSTEFMQCFLLLDGFLGAVAGAEEEQAKKFQWGLRRSTLNHLMCMPFTDVAQVANAARNYEILHERDDDDAKQTDKRRVVIGISRPLNRVVTGTTIIIMTVMDQIGKAMVNIRTDADLSTAVQNALQTLLPQIREEICEEFRTRSGSSNAGGYPPPVTIHTWLECFNKQKPHSFEKATVPVD
nr:hypothetical protein [Tanacetum cinerariifolium]